MNNNKNTVSKILGFIAMAFAIISIPMFFLDMFSAAGIVGANLIDVFKSIEHNDDDLPYVILPIVSMVFALIGAVFSAIPNKVLKIISAVIDFIALGCTIAVVVMVFVDTKGTYVNPGIGLWLNIALLVIAFALALTAGILAQRKSAAQNYEDVYAVDQYVDSFANQYVDYQATSVAQGGITFLSGSCAGYQIPIASGAEIVIGKDPAQCAVVIDKKYAKVSRKHCSVRFDATQGIYIVTDFSTNGTRVVGGAKLTQGNPSYLDKGTTINLAGTENSFRLD